MKRGEIVLIDWPFSDRTGSKVRPAVVVQSDQLNQKLDDTIIALVTSSKRRKTGATTQVLVKVRSVEATSSGLRIDSIIQCENLLTVDQKFVIRRLGTLSETLMKQIDAALKNTLDL